MSFTLKQLAEITHSQIKGNEKIRLTGVATLRDASEGQISFVSNPKYKTLLQDTKASAVVLSPALAENYAGNVLVNKDPYLTFAKLVTAFNKTEKLPANIHPDAVIADDVELGVAVNIGPNVVIEQGVKIGDGVVVGAGCFIGANSKVEHDVHLYPNVTVYHDSIIGCRSIIHSGAIIGADGFGFAPNSESDEKSWYKIPQIGNVVIACDVEIGANTTIDRAALGSTRIGKGVKLDNQIQVGHNVELGDHTIIAGGTVIAGSTNIGKSCTIGGAVAIAGHLTIAEGVMLTGRTMIMKSISEAGIYSSGVPADDNRKWRRNAARFRQLDDMARQVKQLEKQIKQLESKS